MSITGYSKATINKFLKGKVVAQFVKFVTKCINYRRYKMKRVCQYCGRIVDYNHDCPNKPKRKDHRKKQINVDSRWPKIRQQVRERDLCCKLCMHNGVYSPGKEVHHIIPREVCDEDQVFDVNNCIYLCCVCHHKVHETGWKKYVKLFKELIGNE